MKKRLMCLLLAVVMLVGLLPMGFGTASAASSMKVSQTGVQVIKDFVGFHGNAYEKVKDSGKFFIGYGTPSVKGATITKEKADVALRNELAKAEAVTNQKIDWTGVQLVQKQFDAIVWYLYAYDTAILNNSSYSAITNPAATSSEIANIICTLGYTTVYPNTKESAASVKARMAIADLFVNGTYSASNKSSFAMTVFDAGDGYFSNGSKVRVQVYDTKLNNSIEVQNPTVPTTSFDAIRLFQGWYRNDALVTELNKSTADVTLKARWNASTTEQEIKSNYKMPASVLYAANNTPSKDTLIVRADASDYSERINVVNREETVTVVKERIVLETSMVGLLPVMNRIKWVQLSTGGWVKVGRVEDIPVFIPATNVKVTDDVVYLRDAANVNANKTGSAKRGASLTIYMVKDEGNGLWGYTTEGWVYLIYTDYSAEAPSNPDRVIATGTVVSNMTVNVRQNPNAASTRVGGAANGTKVEIYEITTTIGHKWGRLSNGWICLDYVQLDDTPISGTDVDETTVSTSGKIAVVNTGITLIIRSGAGTEYTRAGELAGGSEVEIMYTMVLNGTTWGRVSKGWINMNYVSYKNNESSTYGIYGTVVNCASAANVRSAAGPTKALVGSVRLGSRVFVTEVVNVNGHNWGHIANGWVCLDYVQLDKEWVDPTPVNPEPVPVVTFSGYPGVTIRDTKVRASASSDAKAVLTLKNGEPVSLLAFTKVGETTFAKVTIGSITGWLNFADVNLNTMYVKVSASKADAYELPNVRSTYFASIPNGTALTVEDTSFDGTALWGKVQHNGHAAWVNMSSVSVNSGNAEPMGAVTASGKGYLTGTITAATPVLKEMDGAPSTTTYTNLVKDYRVEVTSRYYRYADGKTFGKVSIGTVSGWIDMANVKLDAVAAKVTADNLTVSNTIGGAAVKTLKKGDVLTVLDRTVNATNIGLNNYPYLNDWGKVYVNDDINTTYFVILDEGKVEYTGTAPVLPGVNPVVTNVVVTAKAGKAPTNVYEEAAKTSKVVLQKDKGSNITILNWKNANGTTWGKVQVGNIIGWVDYADIDFSQLGGTVAVLQLKLYAKMDVKSNVQLLDVKGYHVNVSNPQYIDGILWGAVTVAGKTGYIDLGSLMLDVPTEDGEKPVEPTLIILTGKTNAVSNETSVYDDSLTNTVVSLPKNTNVNITAVKSANGRIWCKVDLAEKSGWVKFDNLTVNKAGAKVNQAQLNVQDALEVADVIYTLYRSETVNIYSFKQYGDKLFGEVEVSDTIGWILVCDTTGMTVTLTSYAVDPVKPVEPTTTQPTAPVVVATPATIVCGITPANVRVDHEVGAQLVTSLSNGTVVNAYEEAVSSLGVAWVRIDQGWVCKDYIQYGVVSGNDDMAQPNITSTVPAGAIAVGYASSKLDVYGGAGYGYGKTGTIGKNRNLPIYERKLDGGVSWARTDNGWVILSYVVITGIGHSNDGIVARCGFTTNVRTSAGINGTVIAKALVNAPVNIIETTVVSGETWAKTDLGWISMSYILNETIPLPPVVGESAPTVSGEVG